MSWLHMYKANVPVDSQVLHTIPFLSSDMLTELKPCPMNKKWIKTNVSWINILL